MRCVVRSAVVAVIFTFSSVVHAQTPKSPAVGEAAPSAQASPTDPQSTSATYGDWVLVCQRDPENPAQRICEISQSIQVQGQQGPIAQLAIAKPKTGAAVTAVAVLPPNIVLTSGPRASVDDKDTQGVDFAWARCLPGGCFAEAALKDDVLKKWRGLVDRGRLDFKDAGGRTVVIPFSFKGLDAAFAALEKQ